MAPDDVDVVLSDDHPLALELSSLREAVSHFQGETHRVTAQLRRQSLEHADLIQHLHTLESENAYFRTELQAYRAAVPAETHRDALQIQELTLALRRLSDKLDLTEKVLLERNEEIASIRHERDFSRRSESSATEAVKRLRSELAASHARERDLEHRVKSSEEQRKMTDIVVEEYASLVRSLEGRPSSSSRTNGRGVGEPSRGSLDGLAHARQGLHKLLQESNHDSEKLHYEIDRLHDALELARSDLQAERDLLNESKQRLAEAQLELHRLRCDDNAAAKMVSRYMKFSQSSTELLHGTIEKLRMRQEALAASYEGRLQLLSDRLASEKRQSDMLRRALDELTEDISREAYGRRREIVLRLRLIAREEMLSEKLRRWLLRSREVLEKTLSSETDIDHGAVFTRIVGDAQDILSFINGAQVLGQDSQSSSARVYAAFATVKHLQMELQRETDRRLYFEFQLADSQSRPGHSNSPHVKVLAPSVPAVRTDQEFPSASSDAHAKKLTPVTPEGLNETHESEIINTAPSVTTEPQFAMKAEIRSEASQSMPSNDISSLSIAPGVSAENETGLKTSQALLDDGEVGSSMPMLQEIPSGPSAVPTTRQVDPPNIYAPPSQSVVSVSDEVETSMSSADGTREVTQPEVHRPIDVTSDSTLLQSLSPEDPDREAVSANVEPAHSVEVEGGLEEAPQSASEVRSTSPFSAMPPNERFRHSLSHDVLQGSGVTVIGSSGPKNGDFADLLSRLSDVDDRYADIQRSFRDCHLALQELRQSSGDLPDSKVLNVVVERLDDYCEDARVELEIRISDEERISSGFRTLLSVPGALSDEVNERDFIQQIEAFIDGSDPTVQRAQETQKRKLEDLEHDIASIKRAMHGTPSPTLSIHDLPEQRSNLPGTSNWSSWTGSILGPSRTSSPAPSFGAVMTSPRLRHSSSTRSMRGDPSNAQSPVASLHLRIPMPRFVQYQGERSLSLSMQRPQTQVATHAVGLGLRGGFGQGVRKSSLGFSRSNYSRFAHPTAKADQDASDIDSDIE